MKYIEAYRDSSGFHYTVELNVPGGKPPQKSFNYGPAPGSIFVDAKTLSPKVLTAVNIEISETEQEYQARIESEIEAICADLEKFPGLPSDAKTDLGKVK